MRPGVLEKSDPERLSGLAAIPPGMSADTDTPIGKTVRAQLDSAQVTTDAETFAEAGWTFVPAPTANVYASDDIGLGVFKLSNGHLGLAGKTLNVKFAADASPSEIDGLLEELGLNKRRSMGFSKNLMTVEMSGGTDPDPFRYSKRLSGHPRIDFAEPVVLESIGTRGDGGR